MLGLDYKQRLQLPPGSGSSPSISKLSAPCGQAGYVSLGVGTTGAQVELWRYKYDSGDPELWSGVSSQTGIGSSEVRIYIPGEYLAVLNYTASVVNVHVVFIPLWPTEPMNLPAEVSRGY